ncbi:MAG: hypothetical protein PHC64_07400 [Candidatus Gastranaerophilales bacterium]|nr:hypothetical protein [Candidatus Gastranaerophilales bacterium]
MKNKITTEDLINKLPKDLAEQVRYNVAKEVEKWGGKRKNAGRKPKTGVVLEFRIRVSEKEKQFIDYARNHNLNYDELMQG